MNHTLGIPQTQTIETERLLLKALTPELWQYIFTYYSDDQLMEYLGHASYETLELEKEKFKHGMTTYFISFRNFLIREKLTGKTIGAVGYHTWVAFHKRAEIGYAITDESFKNKGYMKEAMKAVLIHGFEEMGLHRVEACIGPQNVPSLRLAEIFGFTREGYLREHYNKNGMLHDSISFSMLRPEYEKLKTGW